MATSRKPERAPERSGRRSDSGLTPERLLAEFGPRSTVGAALVRALAAHATPQALTAWTRRLAPIHGERPLARVAHADLSAFRSIYSVDDSDTLLLAVHTYYAWIIKIVGVGVLAPQHRWAADRLHQQCIDLESGRLLHTTGLTDLHARDELGWYVDVWSEQLAAAFAALLARWCAHDLDDADGDLFKGLYHALIPAAVRHALGEYYTPDWLAEHTLDLAGYTGDPRQRCLDASCGSGTFLVLALRRARERGDADLDALLHGVVGFDLNPLAVLAARVNYVLALGPRRGELDPENPREIPVHLVDVVLHDHTAQRHGFDIIVGNPPHVSWRHLPAGWRRDAAALFDRYGLFTLTGIAAQHGGSQKDIAALFIYVVVDKLLKLGGAVALVVHTSLLKTEGAGEGFRRFRLGDGAAFRVEEAHDFSAFQPFQTAADAKIKTRTLSLRARKGEPTTYPVPYHVWTKTRRGPLPDTSWSTIREVLRCEQLAARPLRGPLSPWLCTRPAALPEIQRLLAPSGHVPAYQAHVGAYTGGLNGCYWLTVLERRQDGTLLVENCADIGKKSVPRVRATIEADLVHPLLRGRRTARWANAPDGHILMVQDPGKKSGYSESWLAERYPLTHRFLQNFADELRARPVYQKFFAASCAPFYSMYGVRPETFAPHKVVWMEISATVKASLLGAVDGRIVIPDHKVILVAVDSAQEGDYLTAVLNSELVEAALQAYALDNNVAASLLKNLLVPKFDPKDLHHVALAEAARHIRIAVAAGRDTTREEADLSALTEPLWARSTY